LRDIKQIWFAGVHCDIGGGYKEEERGLSKIALKWMIEEAEKSDLPLDPMLKSNILGGTNPDLRSLTPPARCMSLLVGNGGLPNSGRSTTMTEEPTAKRGVSASFDGEVSGRFQIMN
jgi:hypothetical protein